jgi:hypothetical protein
MVINRQEPPVLAAQRLAASLANPGTGKLLLPVLLHVCPPTMVFNTVNLLIAGLLRIRLKIIPIDLRIKILDPCG